jgi:hypothetical protein
VLWEVAEGVDVVLVSGTDEGGTGEGPAESLLQPAASEIRSKTRDI